MVILEVIRCRADIEALSEEIFYAFGGENDSEISKLAQGIFVILASLKCNERDKSRDNHIEKIRRAFDPITRDLKNEALMRAKLIAALADEAKKFL